jgi:hypothetical protein
MTFYKIKYKTSVASASRYLIIKARNIIEARRTFFKKNPRHLLVKISRNGIA